MVADETEAADMCCASCGIAEVDEIKLNECDDCDLVRYCSDKCQQDHRPQHDAICKERAAELRDEILFKQPERTNVGDCPICFLPLPLDKQKSMMNSCCSKIICKGCVYADMMRDKKVDYSCPFCRKMIPDTKREQYKDVMKRATANDSFAMILLGVRCYSKGDFRGAFKHYEKAAELGNVDAHYHLSLLYLMGEGVEKDEEKRAYHLEEAAIGGHPEARYHLAAIEQQNGREVERRVKHLIIGANLGYSQSIQALKTCYKDGLVSKEEFAAALRGHQAAVDASKSPQREAGEKALAQF